MTVWFEKGRGNGFKLIGGKKVKGGYRYGFWRYKQRHTYPRTFDTQQEAEDAEAELKRKLRRQHAGLEPLEKPLSPKFAESAGAYYEFAKARRLIGNLQQLDYMHVCILRFFGPRPKDPTKVDPDAPYHDLRLGDVVDDPAWLTRFEHWMTKRGISGATKNRYRSGCSRLYWFEMLPENRKASGITANPFRGILRDDEAPRDVLLTPAEIRRILLAAPMHVRIAVIIAWLAPKLRLGNILSLRWDQHFDAGMTRIRVTEHKTKRRTRRPMVAPVSAQLRSILLALKKEQTSGLPWVIHHPRRVKGRAHMVDGPVRSIKTAVKSAFERADVTYGRARGGPTFHTIRHSAATTMAELGVPDGLLKEVLGHLAVETTQGYKHVKPIHEVAPLELLSNVVDMQDAIFTPREDQPARRPKRKKPKASRRRAAV